MGKAKRVRLAAVCSSRKVENARSFVAKRNGTAAVEGTEALLKCADVGGGVCIATPTVAKEEIALAAIAAGKHVLQDKPFADRASVLPNELGGGSEGIEVFMDATHFGASSADPAAIRATTAEKIGSPRSLHTTFYFPFSDH